MARLTIDTGTAGNPATGDTLRTAMNKINTNFIEVYDDLAGASLGGLFTNNATNGDVKIQPNGTGIVEVDQLQINGDNITSLITNGDLTLSGNGTGGVEVLGAFTATSVTSNTISSNGSNAAITLSANGTGQIVLSSAASLSSTLAVTGATTLSSTLAVTGATTLSGGATIGGDTTTGSLTTNTISSNGSNADISIQPSGTGNVVIGALTLNGSTISATDSTQINLNDHVQLDGNVGFHGTTPVAQQSAISYTSDGSTKNDVAIDSILTVLRNYGLIAS
jgi:fibronectin-binding autotransporter adhesin